MNSAVKNTANFCKGNVFSALYDMYAVTPNELKAILKVSAQAGQRSAVNKTSVESTAQEDNFQEIKRRKGHISNNTSQTDKNSTKPVSAVKLPPRAVLTRNFFASPRTTDMDMEATTAENVLPEQEARRKPGRPPPIVMTSTTNLIRL
jgi:hypothetical protein